MTSEERERWDALKRSPNYPAFRRMAARILDQNPELAALIEEEGISQEERSRRMQEFRADFHSSVLENASVVDVPMGRHGFLRSPVDTEST